MQVMVHNAIALFIDIVVEYAGKKVSGSCIKNLTITFERMKIELKVI
jgi:hypothetical protein